MFNPYDTIEILDFILPSNLELPDEVCLFPSKIIKPVDIMKQLRKENHKRLELNRKLKTTLVMRKL